MSATPHIPPRPDGGADVGGAGSRVTWGSLEAVGVYLIALMLAGLATLPVLRVLGQETDLGSMVASAVAGLAILAVLWVWLSKAHRGWEAAVRMPARGRWVPDAKAGVLFGLGLYPAAVGLVGGIVLVLLRLVTGDPVRAPEQVPGALSPVGLAVTVVYAVAIAPLGEELFFRGVLFRALRDRYGFPVGAAGSALAFGLIHYAPGPFANALLLMLVMTFVGFALAFAYERRRAFAAPLAAHVTFNVIGLVLILGLR
jgi:hypothetical protein